jgi:hypothetical protein
MTGRERLVAVLRKRPTDRLPWATLVDGAALSLQPEALRGTRRWNGTRRRAKRR